jgi:molybdopterin converting factor small subunit
MITYQIKCFGMLSEIIGEQISIECNTEYSVEQLIKYLSKDYPKLEAIPVKVAQNDQLLDDSAIVISGTLSMFPPFSGG